MAKILSLDISSTSTGWCVWETDKAMPTAWGANRPPQGKRGLARIKWHLKRLNEIKQQYGPFDLVALEGYPFFLFGANANGAPVRTNHGRGPGNAVFGIAELTGSMKMLIHYRWATPFANFSPSSIKLYATGYGRANKEMMMNAVQDEHGIIVRYDDESDAIYIAQLACDTYQLVEGTLAGNLSPSRDKAIRSILKANNPEGTFSWLTLTWFDKTFGRKKPRKATRKKGTR